MGRQIVVHKPNGVWTVCLVGLLACWLVGTLPLWVGSFQDAWPDDEIFFVQIHLQTDDGVLQHCVNGIQSDPIFCLSAPSARRRSKNMMHSVAS